VARSETPASACASSNTAASHNIDSSARITSGRFTKSIDVMTTLGICQGFAAGPASAAVRARPAASKTAQLR
jgi:hypothetical protein